MNTTKQICDNWASQCASAIKEFLELCQPLLIDNQKLEPKSQFVLSQLFYGCYLASESGLILIRNLKASDAMILIRSIVEGSFKFAFLCSENEFDHQQRIIEYWDEIPEINQIRDFERANNYLSQLDKESETYKHLSHFGRNQEQLDELRKKYPKAKRNQLNQKWSLLEIVRSMSMNNIPDFEMYLDIGFGYGMTSHLVHMDGDFIHMVWLRSQPKVSPTLTEIVMGAKGIYDILEMARLRAYMIHRFLKLNVEPVEQIIFKNKALITQLATTTNNSVLKDLSIRKGLG